MDIGLALPNTVPGTAGRDLVDWAVEGERAGFRTLGTLDRLVYDNYDCLTVLAAAAAVTDRIRLATTIMIAPLRTNTALLAKQVATVDRLSAGRLTLGLAVGARPDDFTAGRASHAGRGQAFAAQVDELRRLWAGERRGFAGGVGPRPTNEGGPELILGGQSVAAITRVAELGDGWISGSGGPGMFRGGAGQVRHAWHAAGRDGEPRLLALAYFALGDDAERNADSYLRDYYGFSPPYAQAVLGNAAVGAAGVSRTVEAFQDAGCDELVLAPCSSDVDQVKLLSDVVGDLLHP